MFILKSSLEGDSDLALSLEGDVLGSGLVGDCGINIVEEFPL